jgi:hypothetical protein
MARRGDRANVRRRGRTWTVEDADPSGWQTFGGGELAAYNSPLGSSGGHVGRKLTSGAEALRTGVRAVRRWGRGRVR